jgi:hypothetical protein
MKLASLKMAAIAINSKGDAMILDAGSTVGLIDKDNDIYREGTLSPQDKMIGFVNTKGKFVPGWLGQQVKLGPALSKKPETVVPEGDTKLHPWDQIRRDLDGLTCDSRDLRWWTKRAKLVASAVREFGASPTGDVAEDVRKLCKLVNVDAPHFSPKEGSTMAATPVKANKNGSKNGKTSSSKAKGEAGPRKRLFSRTVGRDIALACKFGGVAAPKGATQLANDADLSRKQLIELRDETNETSAELRDNGSDKARIAALALSHAVMGVQRLSREA